MATFTPLSDTEASALVADYGLGVLTRVTPISAGSVNSNFFLEVASRDRSTTRRCFLRIYEEQALEGARYDGELLSHLSARGVPAPPPLIRVDGDSLSIVAGKPAAVFPFVAGVHSCQRAVDADRCRSLGRALAQVHVAGASFPQRRAGRFTIEGVRARLPKIAAAEDPSLSTMAEVLARRLDHWCARRVADVPEGVVHGDLFRDNVLFCCEEGSGHDQVAALLDFESASDGRYVYDLAVTILAWCFGDRLDLALASAIVEGYQSVRALTAVERGAMRAELAIAALRFTTTRITDYAMPRAGVGERVIKDFRRFWNRLLEVETIALPW